MITEIRKTAIASVVLTAAITASASAAQLGDVFYIPLENHNFTQPSGLTGSPEQIKGNSAAPYINSLITPGNTNAAQVSYASNYTNAGAGEHPSEPNYIWAEAGNNFNPSSGTTPTMTTQEVIDGTTIGNDNDPTAANHNIFTGVNHLTAQMNASGVSWKNYQEDLQFSSSPTVSAGGTHAGYTNPYNGSDQIGYAVKHNPMAFFSDTATQNVSPLTQLSTDLSNNTVGKYNWVTPNLNNDMHTALTTSFTYQGNTYTAGTGQEAIAQGDNFLSILIPQIMASQAYKNNGAIVIWDDESEGGDSTSFTIPEIVISPLAKVNAYDSTVALNHSSDIMTEEEIDQLGSYLDNPIPSTETSASSPGGYNTVAGSNDLSDLFVAGAIPNSVPEPTALALSALAAAGMLARRRRA